jgi:hypothetical protein
MFKYAKSRTVNETGQSFQEWKRDVIEWLVHFTQTDTTTANRIFDRHEEEMRQRYRNGDTPRDVAHNFAEVWRQGHSDPVLPPRRAHEMRDFEGMSYEEWLAAARHGHGANIRDDRIARRAFASGVDPALFADIYAGGFALARTTGVQGSAPRPSRRR